MFLLQFSQNTIYNMTVGEYKQQIFSRNPEWRAFDNAVTSSKKLSPESYDALECCKQKCDEDEIRAAFRSLEEYALNLLRYPWKSEIKTLRVSLLNNVFAVIVK